jgi:ABC-type sugar transport system permease subunit
VSTLAPATAIRAGRRRRRRASSRRADEVRTAFAMVSPAVTLIVVVAFLPVLYTIYLSLHQATVSHTGGFVGVDNYTAALRDPVFTEALANTAIFTAASVSIELVLGLVVALAINEAFRARGLLRASVLVPWAFPVAISAPTSRRRCTSPTARSSPTARR